jgi:hypothetical protein
MKKYSRKVILSLSLLTLFSNILSADVIKSQDEITWKGLSNAPSYHIRVVGPDGYVYENIFYGQVPSLTTLDFAGDGLYKYEITPNIEFPKELRGQMKAARQSSDVGTSNRLAQQVERTQKVEIVSGNFRVEGGVILGSQIKQEGAER